jgi:hypothetical protein
VTIQGINFGSSPAVTFDGVAGQVTSVNSTGTQIIVTTPPQSSASGANAAVFVTTAGGQSDGGPTFTYTPPPAPTVTGLSPSSGSVTATVSVIISGNNFVAPVFSPLTVKFGTQLANCSVTSTTSITCTAPTGTVGSVDVIVTTYGGQSAATNADKYTYTP